MQNNFLTEMLPLVVFFIAYAFTKNIYLATGLCIIASWVQLILHKIKHKKISKIGWLGPVLITIFGGLTIILHNKTFVMLKPTVLYWLIAISMLIGQFNNKVGIKFLLEKEINLPNQIWKKLNLAWILFFICMGILNLIVAFNFSEYTWVKFKVFGSLSLSLIFIIINLIIIFMLQKKYAKTHS